MNMNKIMMDIYKMTDADFKELLAQVNEKELAPKPTVIKAWKVSSRYQVSMMAEMSDGSEVNLFSYYPDEISFQPSEVMGMTKREAGQLFSRKDTAYLRS